MMRKTKPTTFEDLNPASYNPRKIKAKAAAGLGKSIESFGDISGVTWNRRTGCLVTGHQRVAELRKRGAKINNGAIELNGKSFAIRVVDWSLEQEKTANVAANNPHIAGEFTDGLGDVLSEIRLSIGDEEFAELQLDSFGIELPDIDIGEGTIKEKAATKRFAIFLPLGNREAKKALEELADTFGGHVAECTDENCNFSVRDLDENAWARRRDKLNPQAQTKRRDRGSESQDSEGG
jgi:hypothetical protein